MSFEDCKNCPQSNCKYKQIGNDFITGIQTYFAKHNADEIVQILNNLLQANNQQASVNISSLDLYLESHQNVIDKIITDKLSQQSLTITINHLNEHRIQKFVTMLKCILYKRIEDDKLNGIPIHNSLKIQINGNDLTHFDYNKYKHENIPDDLILLDYPLSILFNNCHIKAESIEDFIIAQQLDINSKNKPRQIKFNNCTLDTNQLQQYDTFINSRTMQYALAFLKHRYFFFHLRTNALLTIFLAKLLPKIMIPHPILTIGGLLFFDPINLIFSKWEARDIKHTTQSIFNYIWLPLIMALYWLNPQRFFLQFLQKYFVCTLLLSQVKYIGIEFEGRGVKIWNFYSDSNGFPYTTGNAFNISIYTALQYLCYVILYNRWSISYIQQLPTVVETFFKDYYFIITTMIMIGLTIRSYYQPKINIPQNPFDNKDTKKTNTNNTTPSNHFDWSLFEKIVFAWKDIDNNVTN